MPKKLSDVSNQHRRQQIYNILRSCSEDNALTVTELHTRLILNGVKTSLRTVSRDLETMSESHKLQATEEMPNRYFTSTGYNPNYQLNFNEEELQTILLALDNLKTMTTDYMKDLCQKTEITLLGKLPRDVMSDVNTLKSLVTTNGTVMGKAVSKDKETFLQVMKALRLGLVFECQYKTSDKRIRKFGPLLLKVAGGETFLFVHDLDNGEVKTIKLCRMKNVNITSEKVDRSQSKKIKNLDKMIGGYGGTTERNYQYEIVCKQEMAFFFEERTFHDSQKITKHGLNYVITFESNDSLEIVRYLAGFGEYLIDVKPSIVFEKVKAIWKSGLSVG